MVGGLSKAAGSRGNEDNRRATDEDVEHCGGRFKVTRVSAARAAGNAGLPDRGGRERGIA
jgi:hypothetical protein